MRIKSFPLERQLDLMDCGPACVKMIAKYYGKFYSLQYLREKCGITKQGVSLHDLANAAESIGLRSLSIKTTTSDLFLKVPLPCIAFWNNSHYIVIYDVSKKHVKVSDPAKGKIDYLHKDFEEKWCLNSNYGIILALERQADFDQRIENEKIERKKTFENVLGYFKPYKRSFVNLLAVMLFITILQAVLPFISKSVIDVGIQTHDINFINIMVVANAVIIFSLMLSNAVRDWILLHVSSRVNISIISDYLMKLMKLPITFFENKLTGDILQRANDHERVRAFIMNNSLNMVFSIVTFLLFGVILFIYNLETFFIFLVGSICYIVWIFSFLKIRKKLDWEYFDLVSKNQSYWVETIESMQEIKINNYEKHKRWKWEGIQARLYKLNIKMLSINNIQNSGAQFIDGIKNLFITFFCAKSVITGEITFGVMISTQFIIGMLNGPIVQFIQFVISAQSAQLSFLRLNEIHQLADEDENTGTNSIDLPENRNLTLNNVFFQYTSNGPVILKGIHLHIPEGKTTAIVGDSGSGKSTLLKLLLRLYKPTYGDIQIGDMNINNISLKQWRDCCGAVMQDGKIFNDTILNNIVLNADKINSDSLKYAVETANIAKEIEQLPLGYQTVMGEMGRGLSGGQKQRILIARALYKNPDFLFFDEATNSLDGINEQKIVDSLEKVFLNKTVIVIAHRLSTIKKADQIIVMQNGGIVEIGDHAILMAQKGRYYDLIKSQTNVINTTSDNHIEDIQNN